MDPQPTDAMLTRLHDALPHARLLSNGSYTVLLSGAGGGYSRAGDVALTAWDGDRTTDAGGIAIYLRDLESGTVWSAAYLPTAVVPQTYEAVYEPGVVRITRTDAGIVSQLEVGVSAVCDVEVRRLRVHNPSERPRTIEVTTYAELVLHQSPAYFSHPAFSKLFVQTELDATRGALLAQRRARSHGESVPWALHALYGAGPLECETARHCFLGRGRTRALPLALIGREPLSGSVGSVLDPVLSLRRVLTLAPGATGEVVAVFGLGRDRDAMLALADRYADAQRRDAVFGCAAKHDRALLHRLGLSTDQGVALQELVSRMLYGDPALRPSADIIARARGGLADQWKYGFGGDGVFAGIEVEGADELATVRELLTAVGYWSARGQRVHAFVVCGEAPGLADAVEGLVAAARTADTAFPTTTHVLRRTELPPRELDVLRAAAQLWIDRDVPSPGVSLLAPEFRAVSAGSPRPAGARPRSASAGAVPPPAGATVSESLICDNGTGAFSADGSEYVLRLEPDATGALRLPPMPWVNVIANPQFGLLVSERGAACTWSRNSHENRLTPWGNDPIADPHTEAVYLRDEETGECWSPLPGPRPAAGAYEVRHGFGYSRWTHVSHGLRHEVTLSVAADAPLRVLRVRLGNTTSQARRLALFAYSRLVLGVLPHETRRSVVTAYDETQGVLCARNGLNEEFAGPVVFAAAVTPPGTAPVRACGDRTAFLGRNGTEAAPAAVCGGGGLDGTVGAGLDPCAALQVAVEVAPGATWEASVLLGEASDEAAAAELVTAYRRPGAVDDVLKAARAAWAGVLDAVQVRTPVPGLDVMLNGWVLYQVLSCRIWGRSAFYQSGGAFGFRDQLQDAAALMHTRPDLTRAQILLHAAHQFPEGDVLHWWHPPTNRGTRTRFSDDLLWLPFVTSLYVGATGDWSVFDEVAGFVTSPPLAADEDEAYLRPELAAESDDVYGHCCRSIDRSLTAGAHGLPLMGTGDWNDGMNRVGREGRGESVWLGFFLFHVLDLFVPVCARRGDDERVTRYRAYQAALGQALEAAWDGAWYRRAYYDDGTPLGAASNVECRIDAIAQAWAAISGAVSRARAAQALDALERELLVAEAGMIRLLTPPFDRDAHDPGYIKGYVPGIRENGGQYTHGAMWAVQACVALGRRDRAAAWLEMLGPVSHARDGATTAVYQVEPYVVAADIYGVAPHVGRGGWTWYTGSAGWMYRIGLEDVLGIRLEGGDTLRVAPCIPDTWPEYCVSYRFPGGAATYDILVRNPTGCAATVTGVTLDGVSGAVDEGTARIAVQRDGAVHRVEVVLGPAA